MTSSNPPASPSHAPAKKQRRDDENALSGDAARGAGPLISLTRRRVWRACESCRRKKIKCDGTEPICGQCTQSNSNCTWIQTRDRAALSRHYVQELENRVIRLEAVLGQVAPQVNLSNLPTGPIALPEDQHQQPVTATSSVQYTAGVPPNINGAGGSVAPRTTLIGTTAGLPPAIDQNKPSDKTDSDEFVAEQMGALALDDHGHLRWIGSSSTMSLIEAFRNFSASDERDSPSPPSTTGPHATPTPNPPSANLLYFPSSLRFGKVRALPGPEEVEYPPWDLADKLIAAYFEKFHHTLPVLDSTNFMNKYRRLMEVRKSAEENGEPPAFGTSKSDAGFVSVVFAVYAVAARFVVDDRLKLEDAADEGEETGGMGMVYYERAMILYYIGATATQLAHVQAFVLLSSFLASLNCLPQAWLLCGQAVRIAQDLGLHRSPKNLAMSPTNKETRRKVWWCVYGLDRMLAAALGRPLGTEDSDCDVEMPLPVDDVDLPAFFKKLYDSGGSPSLPRMPRPVEEAASMSLMAGFNALTQLYMIVGRVLRTVYAVDAVELCKASQERAQKNVESLDRELTEWCEKLPSTFKSDPKSPQQISLGAILCSSYYSALITLHRNFLPTKRKGIPNPNWASVPKAVFASRSCILLSLTTKDAIPRSHHLAFFVQALFSAAVIILLCARFATVESAARTASEEVNTALVCLAALESAWPGAKQCKQLLEELVEATRLDMKVKVPGVGRPGNVNGFVAPTPTGVDKVRTVYNSFKRAANEGGVAREDGDALAVDEKQPRKIKSKPKERTSVGGSSRMSETSSPSSGSGSASIGGQGEVEMDYIQDPPPEAYQSFSGTSINAFTHPVPGLSMSAMDSSNPQSIMKLAESTPTMASMNTFGAPSMYSVPHDWLSSPTADDFNMAQFNSDVFSNIPRLASGSGAGSQQPSQPHSPGSPSRVYPFKGYDLSPGGGSMSGAPVASSFDFSSAEIPFSGFDFLQNFTANPSGVSDGMGGFAANDVAAWQNMVGSGVFSNVPDQPFALVDGAGPEIDADADK